MTMSEKASSQASQPVHILIIEDHPVARSGLRALLASILPNAEIGEAPNARVALESLRQKDWNLVLLDVGLPGRSGLDLLLDIRAEWPRLPVLICTGQTERDFGLLALKAGANGFISKGCGLEELTLAIKRVLDGQKYIGPVLAELLANDLATKTEFPPHAWLSEREMEVARFIVEGKSLKEIGAILSVSMKTVSTYRARAFKKLQIKTNPDLVRYFMKHLSNTPAQSS